MREKEGINDSQRKEFQVVENQCSRSAKCLTILDKIYVTQG